MSRLGRAGKILGKESTWAQSYRTGGFDKLSIKKMAFQFLGESVRQPTETGKTVKYS